MQKTLARHMILRLLLVFSISLPSVGSASKAGDVTDAEPYSPPFYVRLLFETVSIDPPPDLNDSDGQRYVQFLPMAGREDIHDALEGWRDIAGQCESLPGPANDVLNEIATRASETRILIINEAHDRPRHRAFIRDVAHRVRKLGYTVFSAETFGDNVKDSEGLPYIRWFDGTYSNEPVFGSLAREAKHLGFRLAHHEHRPADPDGILSRYDRAARREEGQANNLVQILEGMEDGERLLVHVGYSHAAEVPIRSFSGKQLAWMASRLKDKTGIDPLTIDQTHCVSNTDTTSLSAASTRSVPGQFDLAVAHPRSTYDEGRPLWRIEEGIKKAKIPVELLDAESRVLVEARIAGEPRESVPVDRVLLWPGEVLPLVLPAGRYDLISFPENGSEPATAHIEVE